jgi:transcriptional regulator with XRE-family HTH domain
MADYGRSLQQRMRAIGARARQLRLMQDLPQAELASRAGVGTATIHRFEKTGTASLENVLRIATALHAEAAFDQLFEPPTYASLDEALARPEVARRRRATRKKR